MFVAALAAASSAGSVIRAPVSQLTLVQRLPKAIASERLRMTPLPVYFCDEVNSTLLALKTLLP